MAASRDKLAVTPLTARLWPTFVDLLDEGGPASRCWCMAPRIGALSAAVAVAQPPELIGFTSALRAL